MKARFLLLMFFSVSVLSGFSQEKFEREYRVKASEVPKNAIEFIDKCSFDKKIKWYAEESQDGKTFEAKSRKNNHKFSIEFDTEGTVLDVEKKIKWKEIPLEKRTNIKKALEKRFKKHQVKKVQIQWQADTNFYINLINGKGEEEINEFYEIVVKGKTDDKYELYELLIDGNGSILKELKFAEEDNNNLQF